MLSQKNIYVLRQIKTPNYVDRIQINTKVKNCVLCDIKPCFMILRLSYQMKASLSHDVIQALNNDILRLHVFLYV